MHASHCIGTRNEVYSAFSVFYCKDGNLMSQFGIGKKKQINPKGKSSFSLFYPVFFNDETQFIFWRANHNCAICWWIWFDVCIGRSTSSSWAYFISRDLRNFPYMLGRLVQEFKRNHFCLLSLIATNFQEAQTQISSYAMNNILLFAIAQ